MTFYYIGIWASMQSKYRFSPVRRPVIWFVGTLATVDLGCVAGGYCMPGYRNKVMRPREAS